MRPSSLFCFVFSFSLLIFLFRPFSFLPASQYKAVNYPDTIFRRGEKWCYTDSTNGSGMVFCECPFDGGIIPPTGWKAIADPYVSERFSVEVHYEQADGSWAARLP